MVVWALLLACRDSAYMHIAPALSERGSINRAPAIASKAFRAVQRQPQRKRKSLFTISIQPASKLVGRLVLTLCVYQQAQWLRHRQIRGVRSFLFGLVAGLALRRIYCTHRCET